MNGRKPQRTYQGGNYQGEKGRFDKGECHDAVGGEIVAPGGTGKQIGVLWRIATLAPRRGFKGCASNMACRPGSPVSTAPDRVTSFLLSISWIKGDIRQVECQTHSGTWIAFARGMTMICAWCHPGKRYNAQATPRHAYSHGICEWHKRLMLARMRANIRISAKNAK